VPVWGNSKESQNIGENIITKNQKENRKKYGMQVQIWEHIIPSP